MAYLFGVKHAGEGHRSTEEDASQTGVATTPQISPGSEEVPLDKPVAAPSSDCRQVGRYFFGLK
ncbi:MAG: hypothetical protein WBP23_05895 [Candidatus Saccharimonadales bacterium]